MPPIGVIEVFGHAYFFLDFKIFCLNYSNNQIDNDIEILRDILIEWKYTYFSLTLFEKNIIITKRINFVIVIDIGEKMGISNNKNNNVG